VIITLARWERIRDLFSEDEKDALNAAKTFEVICPRGIGIDESQLSTAIRAKLDRAPK